MSDLVFSTNLPSNADKFSSLQSSLKKINLVCFFISMWTLGSIFSVTSNQWSEKNHSCLDFLFNFKKFKIAFYI